ncbi:MAG: hypothetical protein K6G85_10125 [Eubacterium sp.]|nr:hypothetical protein [Eubacterium sp.]
MSEVLITEELVKYIKDFVDVNFQDASFDSKIRGMIEDGIVELRSYFGASEETEIDFSQPGKERMLLKNYVLYAINKMTDEFYRSYQREITSVRIKYETLGKREDNNEKE